MYFTCKNCQISSHFSIWARLGKYSFTCPNCGSPQNCEAEFNESLKKDLEDWKTQDVV